jgi:putative NIF3 family GTP cyclohydrolase 1 type 2
VCGGAGDSYLSHATGVGADVYLTADLRHHPTREATERGLALVDVAHWASEWPWLADAAEVATSALEAAGHTVSATVSTLVTDPWTGRLPS